MPYYTGFNDLENQWITEGISSKMTDWAQEFGYYLTLKTKCQSYNSETKEHTLIEEQDNALTTTQLRRFFGEIRRIQADFNQETDGVLMLEPKLAYAVGRSEKGKIKHFHEQLSKGLRIVCRTIDEKKIEEAEKQFNRFVMIMEAIVAYHKVKEKAASN